MNGIFLLLGSNIGDKQANLKKACRLLTDNGIEILKSSSIYETAPWGIENQDWFLNIGLKVKTDMDPEELLKSCLSVEEEMGRKRIQKWGSRIIDIDILYYHHQVINEPELKIPHPGIPDRRFTLVLLDELAPNEKHPILEINQHILLENCLILTQE